MEEDPISGSQTPEEVEHMGGPDPAPEGYRRRERTQEIAPTVEYTPYVENPTRGSGLMSDQNVHAHTMDGHQCGKCRQWYTLTKCTGCKKYICIKC